MATYESLGEQLERLLPKSLDDVLRANRDKMRLAFATHEEIQELADEVSSTGVRHAIKDWQFIVMHLTDKDPTFKSVRLFGSVTATNEAWSTSHVVAIDMKNGLVKTSNSTYRLDGPQAAESELDLLHVCASLHYWNLGAMFDVPYIFY